MTVTYHDQHLADRAAMIAMRGFLKVSSSPPIAPEGRPAYDTLMAKTPPPEGVTWTSGKVDGVPGWWCLPPRAEQGAAIVYLHGGCYVLGSAAAYRGFASQIAARARAATFVADYRLAPEHQFPAAFEDACQVLNGMGREGFGKVAVAGDSAGGGLALAALASGTIRTQVVAASLFSPWIDLSLSGETMESRAAFDPILSPTALQQAVDQFFSGGNHRDPRIDAMSGDLTSLPPLRIDVGDDDAYSNETGQEFRSLTGRLFQRYTGRGSEAKPDGRNVSGSWFINVGVYRLGQA